MQRDINKYRDLETGKNIPVSWDIIRKKRIVNKLFNEDPDLKEVLGYKNPLPLNKFADENHPTESEKEKREIIINYNTNIKHPQIVPFIKLNGIQNEVLNFIMFDIEDEKLSYDNEAIKYQNLIIWCLVHEDDIETEYGITRQDLLDAIVRDLLLGSNVLTNKLTLTSDEYRIIDNNYYARMITFRMKSGNGYGQGQNPYDKFRF